MCQGPTKLLSKKSHCHAHSDLPSKARDFPIRVLSQEESEESCEMESLPPFVRGGISNGKRRCRQLAELFGPVP